MIPQNILNLLAVEQAESNAEEARKRHAATLLECLALLIPKQHEFAHESIGT
jgi:hypothetical protein